jgi:hypothetical protein
MMLYGVIQVGRDTGAAIRDTIGAECDACIRQHVTHVCDGRTLRRVQTLPDNRVRTQVLMEAYVIYYN